MDKRFILVLVALLIMSAQCEKLANYWEYANNQVKDIIDKRDLSSHLHMLHMAFQVMKLSNTNQPPELFPKQCSYLKSVKISSLSAEGLYSYLALAEIFPTCALLEEKDKITERYQQLMNENSKLLMNNYYILQLHSILQQNETDIQAICKQTNEFFLPNGEAYSSLKEKEASSYVNTGFALEMQEYCLSKNKSVSAIAKNLNSMIDTLLENSLTVKDNQYFFNELGNSLIATSQIAKNLYKIALLTDKTSTINLQKFISDYFLNFFNFIKENEDIVQTIDDRFYIVSFYNAIQAVDFLSIQQSETLAVKGTMKISYQVVDAFDNVKQNPISTNKFSLYYKKQLVLEDLPVKQASANKQKFEIEIDSSKIKNYGHYALRIVNQDIFTFSYTKSILLQTNVEIENLAFEIMSRKGTPSQLTNKLAFNEVLEKTTNLQANNFIYVKFNLKFEKNKQASIEFIGIKLISKNNKYATRFVSAALQDDSSYVAELDLGDPEIVQPISDTYSLAVIVSGSRIKQNLFWVFSNFHITFSTQVMTKPTTDIDYQSKSPISFTFPAKPTQPPAHFVYFIMLILLLTIVIYVQIISSIGLNHKRMPKSTFKKIVVLIFFALYILSFWLLFYFWVYINFVQTLRLICYSIVPFLFITNYALQYLKE